MTRSPRRTLLIACALLAALLAYARHAVRRFEHLDPESAGAPGAFLDVNGVHIHYVEAGEGDAVVLIHGLNASTFSFRHVIPALARSHRVVALDMKGFGHSARPSDGDYSLTEQARLVAGVMERLAIERAAVVGHSLGGAVAMRLALLAPERVSRLVLVDSASDRQMRSGLALAPLARPFFPVGALFTLHRLSVRRRLHQTAVHDPAYLTPEVLEGHFRPTQMKGHLRALGALMAHRRRDEPLAPERIQQPTLILWGEHDRWLPLSEGEELARLIPNARLLAVRSAGHLPLEEQPALSNRALLDFLRSTEPAGATLQPNLQR